MLYFSTCNSLAYCTSVTLWQPEGEDSDRITLVPLHCISDAVAVVATNLELLERVRLPLDHGLREEYPRLAVDLGQNTHSARAPTTESRAILKP